jgi:hypothetical protein
VVSRLLVSWIPATSMEGGSAEEDMESSPPFHAVVTATLRLCHCG